MAKTFNNLRVGKQFRLTNYGEVSSFQVLEIFSDGNCKLKDTNSLDTYFLFDLTKHGKGDDFDLSDL